MHATQCDVNVRLIPWLKGRLIHSAGWEFNTRFSHVWFIQILLDRLSFVFVFVASSKYGLTILFPTMNFWCESTCAQSSHAHSLAIFLSLQPPFFMLTHTPVVSPRFSHCVFPFFWPLEGFRSTAVTFGRVLRFESTLQWIHTFSEVWCRVFFCYVLHM